VTKVTAEAMNKSEQGIYEAHEALHTHDNKTVIDGITAEKVSAWDAGGGTSVNANWVNIKDHGAVGDGTILGAGTDDTDAIKTAIQYAINNKYNTVYFPHIVGTTSTIYKITDTIVAPSDILLLADKGVHLMQTNTAKNIIQFATNRCHIKGFTLDLVYDSTGNGIYVKGSVLGANNVYEVRDCLAEDITVTGYVRSGVGIFSTGAAVMFDASDNTIKQNYSCNVFRNLITWDTNYGIRMVDTQDEYTNPNLSWCNDNDFTGYINDAIRGISLEGLPCSNRFNVDIQTIAETTHGVYCDGVCNIFMGPVWDTIQPGVSYEFGDQSRENIIMRQTLALTAPWDFVDAGQNNTVITRMTHDYVPTKILTQTEYDNLSTKDPKTMYVITG
jgi:hypothetical protein